jgi:hypothetical protein
MEGGLLLWMSQDSVLDILTRIRAGSCRIRCSIPVRSKRFSFFSHPASYILKPVSPSPGIKRSGRECSADVKNGWN